jgi:AraC-like DNA-binding protein
LRVIKEHFTHPGHSFRFLHFSTDVFRGPWHRHRQIELTWIERGTGIRLVGDSVAPFASGDLILLGANVPHLWMGTKVRGIESSVASVIQFPADLLAQTVLPELAGVQRIVERARLGLQISGHCHSAITRLLIQMRAMDGLRRLAALFAILDELLRHEKDLRTIATRTTRDESTGDRGKRVRQVVAWVHQHLAGPLRIEAAAKVAHITPASFSRFFHRETGKAFSQYVNEVRCSAACLLLKNSDKPIALIAEECGFMALSNFNRQFLMRTGSTPLRYRNEQ